MTQPASRKPLNPTLYLMGFDCYPNDREYFEARRATGSATPYWFKEKLVYEDIAARPPMRTVTAGARRSSMDGTREYGKDSKTVKVEVEETTGDDEASEETKTPDTKKINEEKQPAKRPLKSPRKKIITIPLPKRRVAFPWTPRKPQRPHTFPSHRAHTPFPGQQPKNPKYSAGQQEDTYIDTRPPLHFSHDTRPPTNTIPLLSQHPALVKQQRITSRTV
ncbi:hypothetical protein COCMIDRAFT_97760 [Bipolaris oryzae ATCC 44560]|uniref:Uncharacterized protein n=1 Tax=Bipolaris oryzae ATCC 44560 TaxID=930090 RepID=W6Z4B9_COCMI|nr:uncharacterized protein COCMIDRAFT_97760 [Bipolaris oryzae ATCC 44560]EUC44593.1 hypothetical protein COCMIDRAFT_97760 [Bipolaris oryzae ATCC 44560]